MKTGDIILNFNNRNVESSSKLPPMVGAVIPDTSVSVMVLRDGVEKEIMVEIAELEADKQLVKVKQSAVEKGIGVAVSEVSAADLKQLGLENGVVVTDVEKDSPAAESGLQPGDVIVSINREPIESAEQLESMSGKLPRDKSIPLLVQRGESISYVPLTIPES